MSDDKEKPKDKPVKPATPSFQPGTPIRKEPDRPSIKPAKPSERPGTAMPFGDPKRDRVEFDK